MTDPASLIGLTLATVGLAWLAAARSGSRSSSRDAVQGVVHDGQGPVRGASRGASAPAVRRQHTPHSPTGKRCVGG